MPTGHVQPYPFRRQEWIGQARDGRDVRCCWHDWRCPWALRSAFLPAWLRSLQGRKEWRRPVEVWGVLMIALSSVGAPVRLEKWWAWLRTERWTTRRPKLMQPWCRTSSKPADLTPRRGLRWQTGLWAWYSSCRKRWDSTKALRPFWRKQWWRVARWQAWAW